jgi:hypothetical protein
MATGIPRGEHLRGCNFALRVPCPNGPGRITVDTNRLVDGSQGLTVRAEDAAANTGESRPVTVRVDNTAPGAVAIAVQGGEVWRNQNDFSLTWMNPPEVDRAPITAAHYRLCPATGTGCLSDQRTGTGIDRLDGLYVPGPGEWQFRLWREDAAANQEPANASTPVTLRYDPDPPQLGFEDSAGSDPTRVSVLVSDKLSGLDAGRIEISRQGSGVWTVLPTARQADRLVAHVDDARLPAGDYELRATAFDRARNESSTSSRLDGAPMAITLPLRARTRLRAGVERRVHHRHRHRAHGRRTVLVPEARVRLGRRVRLAGQLRTRDGAAIAGAEVQILERSAVAAEHLVATLRTDAHGRWLYLAHATSTSFFRVYHPGTATTLPSLREVKLLVPAASTIRATPRRLINGQTVTFRGLLRSRPLPVAGKLVELQVVLSGRWQTFQTARTDRRGAWKLKYRFRRSCGVTHYRFRAQLPTEAGYPFEAGRTRPIAIVVRGKPCT